MGSTRRPIGDVLYSLYLIALGVGVVAMVVVDDIGDFGGASDGARAAIAVAAIGAVGLTVASSVRGRLPLFVDLPTLLHVGRGPQHLGWSLRGLLAARLFLGGVVAAIVAFALSRPLASSAQTAVGLALGTALLAAALVALSLALQSRHTLSRLGGVVLVPVLAAALVGLTLPVSQPAVLLVAVLLVPAAAAAAAFGLEAIPFQRLVLRAEVLYETVPRIYLLTPSDLHLVSRLVPETRFSRRVPIDGRPGIVRLGVLAAAVICIVVAAPSPGYGYPVVAGIIAFFVGLETVTRLRIETTVWDRVPMTFPPGHLAGVAARVTAAGVPACVAGLVLAAALPTLQAVGLAVAVLSMGVISALPSALARELRFAELLLDRGPQVLGLAISARMAGPVVLAAAGAVGAHLWATEHAAAGMSVMAAVAAIIALSCTIMVRQRW